LQGPGVETFVAATTFARGEVPLTATAHRFSFAGQMSGRMMQGKTRWIAAAAAVVLSCSTAARAEIPITVLTGGASGVYFPIGVAVGMIYADIPGARVQVQTSDGSVENLMRLQAGRGQVAFALGDALRDAWAGDAKAGFAMRLDRLRVIGALYPSYIQIVATKASGIRTLSDLRGKSLSVGAEKSGTELNARAILQAAGLADSDLGRIDHSSFADATKAMRENKLDATLQSAGLGVTSLKELGEAIDIVVVPVPPAVVNKLGPPFRPGTIPAKTYVGQDTAVATAATMNYLVTSNAVSDDLAYQMTKRLFDKLDELAVAHRAGQEIKLASAATRSAVPLHPGALRYYRDKGLIK
jgi:TRAP transporter TAXI family solute receptor